MTLPPDDPTSRADHERQRLVEDLADVALGSTSAMSRVYASTSAKLNALLLRILRDPADAEEVLQEVYLTVWRRGATFDPARASPITWLVTIARNRAIDRIRSGRTRRALLNETLDAHEVLDPSPSAVEHLVDRESRQRLLGCLGELEEPHRKVIEAAFFQGLTYESLAEREHVPLGTMKSWIRRGLLRLRGCMER